VKNPAPKAKVETSLDKSSTDVGGGDVADGEGDNEEGDEQRTEELVLKNEAQEEAEKKLEEEELDSYDASDLMAMYNKVKEERVRHEVEDLKKLGALLSYTSVFTSHREENDAKDNGLPSEYSSDDDASAAATVSSGNQKPLVSNSVMAMEEEKDRSGYVSGNDSSSSSSDSETDDDDAGAFMHSEDAVTPGQETMDMNSTFNLHQHKSMLDMAIAESLKEYQRQSQVLAKLNTDEEQKRLKMRVTVAGELLSTEETYVSQLSAMENVFIIPLLEAVAAGEAWVSSDIVSTLFSNIQTILQLNRNFLSELRTNISLEDQRDASSVGKLILNFAPFFKLYSLYVNNHQNAATFLATKLAENRRLADFVSEGEQRPECKGLNLQSLLITPIQRIPRYKLLIEQLLKYSSRDTEATDFANLEQALDSIKGVATAINEAIKTQEKNMEILKIQEQFSGNVELISPGREFIGQGPLTKVGRRSNKKVQFFLFSDMVCYATRGQLGKLTMLGEIDIDSTFKVNEVPGSSDKRFEIISFTKSFVVAANDSSDRDNWVNALRHAMKLSGQRVQKRTDSKVDVVSAPIMEQYSSNNICPVCNKTCSVLTRRHCKACGKVVHNACSATKLILPGTHDKKEKRVCDLCHSKIREERSQEYVRQRSLTHPEVLPVQEAESQRPVAAPKLPRRPSTDERALALETPGKPPQLPQRPQTIEIRQAILLTEQMQKQRTESQELQASPKVPLVSGVEQSEDLIGTADIHEPEPEQQEEVDIQEPESMNEQEYDANPESSEPEGEFEQEPEQEHEHELEQEPEQGPEAELEEEVEEEEIEEQVEDSIEDDPSAVEEEQPIHTGEDVEYVSVPESLPPVLPPRPDPRDVRRLSQELAISMPVGVDELASTEVEEAVSAQYVADQEENKEEEEALAVDDGHAVEDAKVEADNVVEIDGAYTAVDEVPARNDNEEDNSTPASVPSHARKLSVKERAALWNSSTSGETLAKPQYELDSNTETSAVKKAALENLSSRSAEPVPLYAASAAEVDSTSHNPKNIIAELERRLSQSQV